MKKKKEFTLFDFDYSEPKKKAKTYKRHNNADIYMFSGAGSILRTSKSPKRKSLAASNLNQWRWDGKIVVGKKFGKAKKRR